MDSICSAVNKTLTHSSSSSPRHHVTTENDHVTEETRGDHQRHTSSYSSRNNLKVHLEIGRCSSSNSKNDSAPSSSYQRSKMEKNSESSDAVSNHRNRHSRRRHHDRKNNNTKDHHQDHLKPHYHNNSRYHTSKRYNGLIFPPPNSEEAAKVSSYIENKILSYRQQQQQQQQQQDQSKSSKHLKIMSPSPASENFDKNQKRCRKCSSRSRHNSTDNDNKKDRRHNHHRLCYRRSSADNHHRSQRHSPNDDNGDGFNLSRNIKNSRKDDNAFFTTDDESLFNNRRLTDRNLVKTRPLLHRHPSPDLSSSTGSSSKMSRGRHNNNVLLKRSNSCDVTNSSNSDSNSLSPSSMSGSETPFSVDEVFLRNTSTTNGHSTTECDQHHHHHQQSLVRFNHSCSCRPRRAVKTKLRNCENIFVAAKQQQQRDMPSSTEHRLSPPEIVSGETALSPSPVGNHKEYRRKLALKTTSLENLQPDQNRMTPAAAAAINDFDNLQHKHKTRTSSSDGNKVNGGRNSHRKECRRHTAASQPPSTPSLPIEPPLAPIISGHTRPDVWPGKAASVVEEPVAALTNNKLSYKKTQQLCFCKRMMGLDHPCKHPR